MALLSGTRRKAHGGGVTTAPSFEANVPRLLFERSDVHTNTTAPEIWEQTGGEITHFVCGLGTSGTFVGTSRKLKELAPSVQCISLQPDGPLHGLEGWKHMPSSIVPGIYDPTIADAERSVATEDAYAMMARLAREEGLFVSASGAGALVAALEVAEDIERGVVVTVFPDSRGFHDTAA